VNYLAVFASGTGTNLQAIIDAIESGRLPDTQISVVVCNKKGAQALERAQRHGIPTIYHPFLPYRQKGLTREDYDLRWTWWCWRAGCASLAWPSWSAIPGC